MSGRPGQALGGAVKRVASLNKRRRASIAVNAPIYMGSRPSQRGVSAALTTTRQSQILTF
jgi:hypothetical protein